MSSTSEQASNEPQEESGDELAGYAQEWCKGTPPLGNHIPQYVMLHEQFVPGVGYIQIGHCPQCGKEFIRYD